MICELLAPAGNPECALAAADAGADAVYCGLARFNARERAANFTLEQLSAVIENFHRRNKKVYVTFNTLLHESELADAARFLADLAFVSPDALIVQDLAVLSLAKEYFPSLALHASTQMGIHNSAGVAAAARMGFSRVILERQISPEELRAIVGKSKIEIEVFVHGSLCCSLSGRCLLSQYLGGGSGNRGSCKQPCRRCYERENGRGFFLSMKDLNSMDRIGEFRRLGVSSLKIEGRLRGPDYIHKVVSAYRMLLDGPEEPPEELYRQAAALLHAAGARNETAGFVSGGKGLTDPGRIGVFGRNVGTIAKVLRKGMLVKCTEKLHLGDRLRIVPPDGGDGESFSLVSLEKFDTPVSSLRKGESGFIPGDFHAEPGNFLFKIGENGFDFSRAAAALPPGRTPLEFSLSVTAEKLTVSGALRWEKVCSFAPAEKAPLQEEHLKEVFLSGAPEPWRPLIKSVHIEGSFFVPAAVLKTLRREFWEAVKDQLAGMDPQAPFQAELHRFSQDYALRQGAAPATEKAGMHIPSFIPERDLELWRKKIRAAYDSGVRLFRCDGLHALELMREFPEARLRFGFFPGVSNSQAAHFLLQRGLDSAVMDPQLSPAAARELAERSPLPLIPEDEPVPVLVTRAEIGPEGVWHDRKGTPLAVKFDRTEGLWKLFPRDSRQAGPGSRVAKPLLRFQRASSPLAGS